MVFYIKSSCGGRPQYLSASKPKAGKTLRLSFARDTPWVWDERKQLMLYHDQSLGIGVSMSDGEAPFLLGPNETKPR